MSSIKKLGIKGIRSFGPDHEEKIDFFSPLTLILGQNGCGKTTIIESLKYMTTGEAPPGTGRGASFVHDPKICNENSVRGNIRLLFNSIGNQSIKAERAMEVTQKTKKMEFKTLESTLVYTYKTGEKKVVSSKNVDFQNELSKDLGVSKPILENVIFCHQEESNWP